MSEDIAAIAKGLTELAERCEAGAGFDLSLEILIEVTMFEPDGEFVSIRPNAAGTKVICTRADGSEATFAADDWTIDRADTAALLRTRAVHLTAGDASSGMGGDRG